MVFTMPEKRDLLTIFAQAADRARHERSRLSQVQRDALAREIRDVRKLHLEAVSRMREQQGERRLADMASARQALLMQKRPFDLKPPEVLQTRRIDYDRVEILAAHDVEASHAQEIGNLRATMRQEVSEAIDSFLGRQPTFRSERESIDLARARWSELRAATRYEGHSGALERDDGGQER